MSYRKEVWIKAWCAVAGAFNCKDAESATKWADKALKAYDERFNKKEKHDIVSDDTNRA